ncbi:MAG: hypothetical protein IJF68_04955 [Opitutales bacterium]|nr:hypothetical protein [Opitutales bacterium]
MGLFLWGKQISTETSIQEKFLLQGVPARDKIRFHKALKNLAQRCHPSTFFLAPSARKSQKNPRNFPRSRKTSWSPPKSPRVPA